MEDKYHGEGTLLYKDDYEYYGMWYHGKRHGLGILTHPDGTKKMGHWKDNLPLYTYLYYTNGEKYYGKDVNFKPNGCGLYKYTQGDLYKGQYFNGMQHGLGYYYFNDSNMSYLGEVVNGKFEGIGIISCENFV